MIASLLFQNQLSTTTKILNMGISFKYVKSTNLKIKTMLFGNKDKKSNLVKDAKDARTRASMFISQEITDILKLITGLSSKGKTSISITKELENDTVENLKMKNFTVERVIGSNSEEKFKIKW